MTNVDDLLKSLPIDAIAEKLGVSTAEAQSPVEQALAALLGGLRLNAQDADGAASLATALTKHEGKLEDNLAGNFDIEDGQKILGHVFGDKQEAVAAGLATPAGLSAGLVSKAMPILAPIVLSFLAKNFLGKGQPAATDSDGGLGGLLGGLLSGGSSQGGLSDLLGGLLGGNSSQSSTNAGGLASVLGSILGK